MAALSAYTGFPGSACSLGLSATSQQYFYLRTNQPPATSQQYSSLRTNQHQPSATSQPNKVEPNSRNLAIIRNIQKVNMAIHRQDFIVGVYHLPVIELVPSLFFPSSFRSFF
jgi:hypothetical protein